MENIYHRVTKLANQNDISLAKLARQANVNPSTLFNWKEAKKPRLETLKRVADVLGTTPEFLAYGRK